jgi:hypothetical protein
MAWLRHGYVCYDEADNAHLQPASAMMQYVLGELFEKGGKREKIVVPMPEGRYKS